MKNLFLILFLILGIGITYAGKNYKVTVTYEIIYEYYDDSNGSYMGEKPAGTSSNKFSFYAETPHEAEEEAISQCSSTCSSSGTFKVRENTRVKNAKYIKKEGLFLQEHNNKKASMKVKNFRSNSTMTFLFIVTTTLLFSSCASFISTMESTDWKKTTNDNIELLNDAMQTGSNKDK